MRGRHEPPSRCETPSDVTAPRARPRDERGAALVIALLLLVVSTLLATTGMRTSIAELWMAGSEQFHRRAVEAASAGVEAGIARVRASRGKIFERHHPRGRGRGRGRRWRWGLFGDDAACRHRGLASRLERREVYRRALRDRKHRRRASQARDVQVQGVLVISSRNGVRTFRRIGEGLGAEPIP